MTEHIIIQFADLVLLFELKVCMIRTYFIYQNARGERRMKNRILSLMLGLSLLIGTISGCGFEDTNASKDMAAADQGTASQTATPEPNAEEQTEERELYLAKKTVHGEYAGEYYGYGSRDPGSVTEYEYNEQGNLVKMSASYESTYAREGTTDTHSEQYEYDTAGNVLRQSTQHLYDWSDEYSTTYNEETTETEYEYDAAGNLIRKKSSHDSTNNYFQNSTEYSYGSHSKESGTEETSYEYDPAGNLIRMRYMSNQELEENYVGDGEDNDNSRKESDTWEYTYVYDNTGKLLKETEIYVSQTVWSNGDESTNEYTYWTEYEYDDNGYPSRMSRFVDYRPDSPIGWEEYEYDQSGNLLREIEEHSIIEYEYDADGNQLKETYYYDGKEQHRTENEYDGAGHLAKSREYYMDYSSGEVRLAYEAEFDAAGNQIKSLGYYYSSEEASSYYGGTIGSISYWSEYTFDEKGNQTESIVYNVDGSISSRSEYTFDDEGNIMEINNYDADGNINYKTSFSTEEELDEDGRLIKSTSCVDDELVSWIEYEYK